MIHSFRFRAFRPFVLAAALLAAGAAKAEGDASLVVVMNQAKVVQLPANAATVIVGNPLVADVTLLKNTNQMILTGKSFGQTNLIALDSRGKSVGESSLRVIGSSAGLVVQRGLERETWDCAPWCQPTISLGDAPRFMSESAAQAQARNAASAAR